MSSWIEDIQSCNWQQLNIREFFYCDFGYNHPIVQLSFDKCVTVSENYKFTLKRVFNIDETGILSVHSFLPDYNLKKVQRFT